MARLRFGWAFLFLVGCSYDFGMFDGAGGASTGGSAPLTTSDSSSSGLGGANVGGDGGANVGGGGPSTSSSSVGTGGAGGSGPTFYPACGDHTDSFQTLDTSRWTLFHATHDSGNQLLRIQPAYDAPNNLVQGFAHLRPAPIASRCFLSMRIRTGSYSTLAYMALLATPKDWLEVRTINRGVNSQPTAQWRRVDNLIEQSGTPLNTPDVATNLGMLVESTEAFFFVSTDNAATWISLGTTTRPTWLNATVEPEIGVYAPNVGQAASNEGATLDDFNVPPVEVGTLPSP